MAAPLKGLPPGFVLDEPDTGGLPPGFVLDEPAPASEESFGQRVLGSAASTADIVAEGAVGAGQWISRPFRRIAGVVTGETEPDITASEQRVATATASPIGSMLGVAETPSYQNNMIRQALGYVGGVMDTAAEEVSNTTGVPKGDVLNMMQSAMAIVPLKVPGTKTAGRLVKGTVNKAADVLDPKTAFYMDIAEGRAPELIAAARSPQAEIIPGVRPTFSQATADVGLPRLAAVGEQAKTEVPMATATAQAIKDAQEAARVQQLRTIERTPERRALAEEVRTKRKEPLYQAAETAGNVVNVAPVLTTINDLIAKNPGNAPLLTEMRRLRTGLTKPGLDPQGNPIRVPRTDAQEIMSTIEGIKTALAKEDNKRIKSQLTGIKDDLTAAIPFLPEAEAAFKKGSRPINQMDMATYLREKLESPIPDANQRAAAFAGAVRDAPRTIKQALEGAPPYQTFTEAGMSKTQQRMIDDIVIDLSRDARVKELAQAGSKSAPKLMKTPGKFQLPPVFNVVVTVANDILRRVSGKLTDKMALDIAMEFLDAERAAAALETALRRTGRRQAVGRKLTAPFRAGARAYSAVEPNIRAGVVTSPNMMQNERNRNAMAR